jgi:hypothetical protein
MNCAELDITVTELRITGDFYQALSVTSQGQNVFAISRSLTAVEITRSRVYINGIKLILNTDYTISGDQLDISLYGVVLEISEIAEIYF